MSRRVTIRLGFEGDIVEKEIEVDDDEPTPWDLSTRHSVVGTPVPRQESADKVTGRAKYTSDVRLPGMLYGRLIVAVHPHAAIRAVDTAAAERAPGVRAVHVLEDRTVRYAGQPIAAVAADTPEQAEDAVHLVRVDYDVRPFVATIEDARRPGAPSVTRGSNVRADREVEDGDVDGGLERADLVVRATYETQVQTHSALEPHGIVARWDAPDRLTVWCSTQGTFLVRENLARYFRLSLEDVRVHAEHVGGGFGAKFGVRPFELAACELAKKSGKPVQLLADRATEHRANGNRPSSVQSIAIGATKDGKLTAIDVSTSGAVGVSGNARCAIPIVYRFPAARKTEESVQIHAGPSCAHRAPAHPQGVFALEQAMDELAWGLGLDPLEFRKRNDPNKVRLAQWDAGARAIGWDRRRPEAGGGGGRVVRGLGLAASRWGGTGRTAEALVVVHKDGRVEVKNGAQDIGTGTRTGMAIVAAEELGIPVDKVTARLGDTDWPDGPPSGGSVTAASIFPAVRQAAFRARTLLLREVARGLGVAEGDVALEGGAVRVGSKTIPWDEACRLLSGDRVSALEKGRGVRAAYAEGTAGCQFAEVEVDTATGVVRVLRVVAVHDCGRTINRLSADSQIQGGVIQGLAYALFEDRILDRSTGHQVNPDLLFYKVPGIADVPAIVSIPFDVANGLNSTSVVGLGEPPIIPTAAAIANAIYHATGKRVRRLPMTPDVVLASLRGDRR